MSIKYKHQFEADGDFPLVIEKWPRAIYGVKTKAQRNAIPADFRVFSSQFTTLVYVTELGSIFELINNPSGTTQDSDWNEVFDNSQLSPETLIGEWEYDNTSPVLTDAGASGKNGQYYLVTGAPTATEVTHANLFQGNTKSVTNGDMIISAGTYWIHRKFDPQVNIPESLLVTQLVDDIAGRNALTRWEGMRVIVLDCTGDSDSDTVDGEPAEYIYQPGHANADGQGFVTVPNSSIDVLAVLVSGGKLKDTYIPTDLRGFLGAAPMVSGDDGEDLGASLVNTYTGSGVVDWNLLPPADGPSFMILNVPTSGAMVRLNGDGANEIYGVSGSTPFPCPGKNSFIIFNDGVKYGIKS